jgi:hypothetical protein
LTAGTGYTAGPVSATFSGSGGAAATADLKVVSVTLTAAGSGYTSDPTVAFDSGTAAGTTTIKVVSVTITAPGSYTAIPTAVHFSSGAATGTISAVTVVSVAVTAGTGYTTGPVSATFSGSGGAVASADLKVVSLALAGGGGDYTSMPTVTITPQSGDTTGAGATASLTVGVLAVAVSAQGTGYGSGPTVTFSGGGGTTQATGSATIAVNAVALTFGGGGYSSAPTVTISGASGLTATATINPGNIMTAGTSTANAALTSATAGSQNSPVTDVFDPGATTDILFFGYGTSAGAATVVATNSSTLAQTSAAEPSCTSASNCTPAVGFSGTSAIVVDPVTTGGAQANSIYFATQGNASTDVYNVKSLSWTGTFLSSSTATVTLTAASDIVSGDTVTLAGITCSGGCTYTFNGPWTVTATSSTTFTFQGFCTSSNFICIAGSATANTGTATNDGLENSGSSFKAVKLTQSGLQ